MACTLCSCEDHPNQPCVNCLNCVGHLDEQADYDQDHTDYTVESTEYTQNSTTVHTKPRYKYNAKTGEIREVTDVVRDAFGL
jgi:hypothetical protein